MTINAAASLPVLDFHALSNEQLATAEGIFNDIRDRELKPAPFQIPRLPGQPQAGLEYLPHLVVQISKDELTGEWGRRGVQGEEYGIRTNVIQEGTFGLEVKPHMAHKGLKKHHNLRDHMTSLEMLFTTLGERSTKDIAIADDALVWCIRSSLHYSEAF